MQLLDSNVLVADFNPSDALHSAARRFDFSGAVVNELVFAEVVNVLERRVRPKEKALLVVEFIRKNFPVERSCDADLDVGLRLFSRHFGRLSFTDCVLLAHANRLGCVLVTFDENLKAAAKAEGVPVEPA